MEGHSEPGWRGGEGRGRVLDSKYLNEGVKKDLLMAGVRA